MSPCSVTVYYSDRQFVRSFGERTLKDAYDITANNDGRVLVLDKHASCVHTFSEDGDHLNQFKPQGCYNCPRIAFHRASEHVVIACVKGVKYHPRLVTRLHVEIHTKDGEFVRSIQIEKKGFFVVKGMTVTMEGRIAVVLQYIDGNYNVLVV